MSPLDSNVQSKKVTIASLYSCIYLPSVIAFACYYDSLYSLGKRSSFYILIIIMIAESLKVLYCNGADVTVEEKKNDHVKNTVGDILKSVLHLFGMLIAFFLGTVVYDAPVLGRFEESIYLALLLLLLTVFPLALHSGLVVAIQLLLLKIKHNEGTVQAMLVNNTISAVCAGWSGAIMILPPWNMPWQDWPIPCYLGVIVGYLLANVLTVIKAVLVSAAIKYPGLNAIVNFIDKGPIATILNY